MSDTKKNEKKKKEPQASVMRRHTVTHLGWETLQMRHDDDKHNVGAVYSHTHSSTITLVCTHLETQRGLSPPLHTNTHRHTGRNLCRNVPISLFLPYLLTQRDATHTYTPTPDQRPCPWKPLSANLCSCQGPADSELCM